MNKSGSYISLFMLLATTNSCIEEFNAGTIEFEDAIVVEATITNEFKYHTVILSRTYKFEDYGPTAETNATVRIVTSSNTTYDFHETSPGTYISNAPFSAQSGNSYQLAITSKGKEYVSKSIELRNSSSTIDNVYGIRETDRNGRDGIAVYVDSFDPTNSSKYYGYESDETYQIVAPYWVPDQFIIINQDPIQFEIGPRTKEERECYITLKSFDRLYVKTTLLSEDRISKLLIKFIPFNDLRVNSRYSVLVRQYIQTAEAFRFRETLNNLSTSQSLFSQSQPGFLAGNISSVDNPDEKVIGFFEVSTVSEKRFFLNRSDYTTEPFSWFCRPYEPSPPDTPTLSTLIRLDRVSYFSGGRAPFDPIVVVQKACGDCTELGSNIKPNFWID
tara:strand:+ start:9215 stop:10378 length:1164 start_codon:yes stop_codon:yes gene_type:complete